MIQYDKSNIDNYEVIEIVENVNKYYITRKKKKY